ncbi:type VII secretion protein EccB [Nocardia sp. CDC153]|uniref:type VII secretion protein EccB n=1 Tax=Nocardia sp. CDC153 TaxID=3112167 RepID=UPI002DBAF623|nr:type VII secretion protein EccB [Nocardia sp. CDC153]MEC3955008.1 type VII secretion protein EccB [Nocardia sp. CDC153]
MPAQLTTRAQVNGYRFLLRRLDHALVRRDVRMLHDPMRSQFRSLMVGAVLALLVVAGAAIMAFIRPQGSIGNANIVMGKDSGALYVVIRDKDDKNKMTLYPTLNLASARLIAGTSETPTSVKDAKLNSVPRGPILGIPGVPAALPGTGQGDRSQWTLCDRVPLSASGGSASSSGAETTVISGSLELSDRAKVADKDSAIWASKGGKDYLIYDGKVAEFDKTKDSIAQALGLSGKRPRPATTDLIGAGVKVPPLVPPSIPRVGENGMGKLSSVPVGGIIKVSALDGSDRSDLYVVLADGVQRISAFTAQVIGSDNSQGMNGFKSMTPDVLNGMPVVHTLPVDDFPNVTPKIITADDNPVACITWAKKSGLGKEQPDATEGPSDRATVQLLLGTRLPLPDSRKPVDLATKDGASGDRVDAVYVPPTTGEFVRTTGIEPGSQRRENLFYIADNGIRYGIPDLATAQILGLGATPHLAPWEIVGQLVPGPTLSKQDALKYWDTLPTQ